MNTKFNFNGKLDSRIVYIREVSLADLPDDLQAEADGLQTLYAVHDAAGERLALVRNRAIAFMLARQNDFAAVSVH